MSHANWTTLFARAGLQGGIVTAADALDVGVSRSTFYRRVRAEQWHEVFTGAWLLPGATLSMAARHWAAVLSSGPESALSHSTAARLHELCRPSKADRIHIVRTYGRRADPDRGLVRHRSRVLADRDRTTVDGLPVTTAARTLLDIAGQHAIWQLEGMMLAARQRRLLDLPALVEQHERRPGLRGASRFLAAARLLSEDGADSVLERRARSVLRDAGLHPSPAPHPVVCGDVTLHVDIAFPRHRFGIECDGFAYHAPDDREVFEHDRDRWRLLQDAGWRLTWLTWKRLHASPAAFIAEVRSAVGA